MPSRMVAKKPIFCLPGRNARPNSPATKPTTMALKISPTTARPYSIRLAAVDRGNHLAAGLERTVDRGGVDVCGGVARVVVVRDATAVAGDEGERATASREHGGRVVGEADRLACRLEAEIRPRFADSLRQPQELRVRGPLLHQALTLDVADRRRPPEAVEVEEEPLSGVARAQERLHPEQAGL